MGLTCIRLKFRHLQRSYYAHTFFMVRETPAGQDLLIFEISRSHAVIHNILRKNPLDG